MNREHASDLALAAAAVIALILLAIGAVWGVWLMRYVIWGAK